MVEDNFFEDTWEGLEEELDRILAAESKMAGIGTPKAGYAKPEEGPFKCSNCQHSSEEGTKCAHPTVVEDLGSEGGKATVEPEGCCNYFRGWEENE